MNNLDTTQCYPLNKKLLSDYLRANVESKPEFNYEFDEDWAVIPNKGVICTEIVAREFVNKKVELGIMESSEGHLAMFPKWRASFTESDLMSLTDAPIMVGEFVQRRRGYNGRLELNESIINEWLGEK